MLKTFIDNYVRVHETDESMQEIYTYGLMNGLAVILNIATIIFIGFLTERLLTAVLIMLTYIPLRTLSGGYHAKTFIRCYVYSVLFILVTIVLSELSNGNLPFISYAIVSFSIFLLGPVDTKNKRMDLYEKKYNKKRLAVLISIYLMIGYILYQIESNFLYNIMFISILSVNFMLLIGLAQNRMEEYKVRKSKI